MSPLECILSGPADYSDGWIKSLFFFCAQLQAHPRFGQSKKDPGMELTPVQKSVIWGHAEWKRGWHETEITPNRAEMRQITAPTDRCGNRLSKYRNPAYFWKIMNWRFKTVFNGDIP